MPNVTLRYSVIDANKTMHRFSKDVELPIDPTAGLIIRDLGMPSPLQVNVPITENENMIAFVRVDTATSAIIADLFSGHDGAMTVTELAVSYARYGWRHDCGPGGCRTEHMEPPGAVNIGEGADEDGE